VIYLEKEKEEVRGARCDRKMKYIQSGENKSSYQPRTIVILFIWDEQII